MESNTSHHHHIPIVQNFTATTPDGATVEGGLLNTSNNDTSAIYNNPGNWSQPLLLPTLPPLPPNFPQIGLQMIQSWQLPNACVDLTLIGKEK